MAVDEPQLDVLVADPSPEGLLTPALARRYGSQLRLPDQVVYANFVSSLDGVVAIPGLPQSNRLISGSSASDRFVMGLLRALADAVVIGSGTLAASRSSTWAGDAAFPDAATDFAELRAALGLAPAPTLVVVAGMRTINLEHPALHRGATVLAPRGMVHAIRDYLPPRSRVFAMGSGSRVDVGAAFDWIAQQGHRRVLSEAGPHLFGSMLRAGLVDELFVTLAPRLAGRAGEDPRLGLVEGVSLLPGPDGAVSLRTLHRSGDELLARYALRPAG